MSVVDVRAPSDIMALKNEIEQFREMLLLIYSDTCGHCHRYKALWDKLHKIKPRKRGLASINSEQLANTDFADLKIRGYPSVIKVVNGRPAEMEDKSNAMNEEYRDPAKMENLVNGKSPFLNEGENVTGEPATEEPEETAVANSNEPVNWNKLENSPTSTQPPLAKSTRVEQPPLANLDTQVNSGRLNNTQPPNTQPRSKKGSKPVVINTNNDSNDIPLDPGPPMKLKGYKSQKAGGRGRGRGISRKKLTKRAKKGKARTRARKWKRT